MRCAVSTPRECTLAPFRAFHYAILRGAARAYGGGGGGSPQQLDNIELQFARELSAFIEGQRLGWRCTTFEVLGADMCGYAPKRETLGQTQRSRIARCNLLRVERPSLLTVLLTAEATELVDAPTYAGTPCAML